MSIEIQTITLLFLSLKVPSSKGTDFKKNKLECSINGSVCEALVSVAFNDKKKKNRKKNKVKPAEFRIKRMLGMVYITIDQLTLKYKL